MGSDGGWQRFLLLLWIIPVLADIIPAIGIVNRLCQLRQPLFYRWRYEVAVYASIIVSRLASIYVLANYVSTFPLWVRVLTGVMRTLEALPLYAYWAYLSGWLNLGKRTP